MLSPHLGCEMQRLIEDRHNRCPGQAHNKAQQEREPHTKEN